MTENNLKAIVYGRLEAIMAAEKITRAELGALSRELLIYVPETNDIDIVNRLVNVLTKANSKVAILYFKHFLPWEAEETPEGEHSRFGKMMQGDKKVKRRLEAIDAWLKDEGNTIWNWMDANVEIGKKKDFAQMIKKAIEKALKGDEKTDSAPLSKLEVVMTVLETMTIDEMLAGLEVKQQMLDLVAKVHTPQADNKDEPAKEQAA